MEDRDSLRESGNGTKGGKDSLGYLVLLLEQLVAFPIEQIGEGNEVMHSAWLGHVKVSQPVAGNALHAFNLLREGAFGHRVCLVLGVEELNWQIVL